MFNTLTSLIRVVMVAIVACIVAPAYGEEKAKITLDVIAKATAASDAQFSILKLRFIRDGPAFTEAAPRRRSQMEVSYAHDLKSGTVYLLKKEMHFDPVTNQKSNSHRPDREASFDGVVTTVLDLNPGRNGNFHAVIYPGKRDATFQLPEHPHGYMFRASPVRAYADLFERGEFAIISTEANIDGERCVHVRGNNSRGKPEEGTYEAWFAIDKSFLPIKSISILNPPEGPQIAISREFKNLIKLENGIWYPTSIRAGNFATVDNFTNYSITECSTLPLPQETFHVKFPGGTKVYDIANKQVFVTTEASTRPVTSDQDLQMLDDLVKDYVKQADNAMKK